VAAKTSTTINKKARPSNSKLQSRAKYLINKHLIIMNTKLRKLVKLTAAGLFIIALAINIKVTLDDPFVMLSEAAIATGSGTDGGTDAEPEKNGKYQAEYSVSYNKGDKFSANAEVETSWWVLKAKAGGGYEKVITKTVTVTGLRCCQTGDPNTDYCSPYYPACPT